MESKEPWENHNDKYLRPPEAAALLGIKVSTLYRWVHLKQIPYRKHGRLLCFDEKTLREWSKRREIKVFSPSY